MERSAAEMQPEYLAQSIEGKPDGGGGGPNGNSLFILGAPVFDLGTVTGID